MVLEESVEKVTTDDLRACLCPKGKTRTQVIILVKLMVFDFLLCVGIL